ncbi:MAG: helix-turn-helix transcriptional regulator [Thermoleophilia bacterium]|nr:helix-turn-helix transcriptional regulator [Thermoleophilia bacterium]
MDTTTTDSESNEPREGSPALREELAARRQLPPPAVRRALRERSGLSAAALARELGVTRQAVASWERGARFPRAANLVRYAALLRLLAGERADG